MKSMTIEELIRELQNHDKKSEVCFFANGELLSIDSVEWGDVNRETNNRKKLGVIVCADQ